MQTTTEALPTTKSPTIERDPIKTVIFASMIGTAVEFFDFYAYGTAAATYFPKVFFPSLTPSIAILLSLLTFGVAFVARPLGSFIFGHYGDKIGRKKTLVVSLILMGGSTVLIGFYQVLHRLVSLRSYYFVYADLFKELDLVASGLVLFW